MLLFPLVGCASRQLTIVQGDYVNTAMHQRRPVEQRTGERLEVDFVMVYPNDLKSENNTRLSPQATDPIYTAEWFQRRPIAGDTAQKAADNGRFWLPKSQILLLTDASDKDVYGTRVGSRLGGARNDGKSEIRVRPFDFKGPLHDEKSVIYVFPKFIDASGAVMNVAPARFHPPGAYTDQLVVEITTDPDRGQQIVRTSDRSPRKLHGKEE
ncbi:MAG TPA: hypothetical protein VGM03_19845 [Phycisphaerae bacterium]